jgi:sodium-coupled monocarboxylate transporter 8/12
MHNYIASLLIVFFLFFFLRLQNDSNYLYLYRISYMYYIVLGFIVTFIVALIISAVFKESYCNNPDLFTPFVAKRLRKHGLLLKIKSTKMVHF